MKLSTVLEQLRKQGKELLLTEEAITKLCRNGYDYEYGARNLERVLRRNLLDKLARLALHEEWISVKTLVADWENEDISIKVTGLPGFQEIMNTPAEAQDYLEE